MEDLAQLKGRVERDISQRITEELTKIKGNRSIAKRTLKDMDPDALSRIGLRGIVNGMILKVDWSEEEREAPTKLTTILSRIGEKIDPELTMKEKAHIGAFVFDCAVKCGYVAAEVVTHGKMSTAYPARTDSEEMIILVKRVHAAYPDQYIFGEWQQAYNNDLPIVKKMDRKDSYLYTMDRMPKVYKALNLLGGTEWLINRTLFDIMSVGLEGFTPDFVSDEDAAIARTEVMKLKQKEIPFADWVFKQRMNSDSFLFQGGTDKEAADHTKRRKAAFKKLAKVSAKTRYLEKSFDYTKTISNHAKMSRFFDTLDYCQYNQDAILKFVYNLDSRGRIYSAMLGVSPQGSDMEKALLQFKEGVRWSDQVERNLCIHTANSAGEDKLSFSDRVKWTKSNMDNILEAYWALKNDGVATEWLSQFANEKKTKWQLIAAIMVWGDYQLHKTLGDTKCFSVYISAGLDATTSGLQILSILGRDDTVAEHVNIKPCSYAPVGDLYQVVGNHCHTDLHTKSEGKEQKTKDKLVRVAEYEGLAHGEKLWRKMVKRGTMTFGYSCGAGTMGKSVFFDRKEHGDAFVDTLTFTESSNFGLLMHKSIEKSLPKAAEIMKFLQGSVKEILADGNKAKISWVTPSGFIAYQSYKSAIKHRVEVRIGGKVMKLTVAEWIDKPQKAEHRLGIAANFVHSLDSALLVNTVCELGDKGYTNFHFIHDSFGVDMGGLMDVNSVVRNKIHSMFAYGCPLEDFIRENKVDIDLPTKGDYDIDDILVSEYCFC